jgi:hypothetical protein
MKRLISGHARLLTVAIACVALGAGAGVIASAGASPSKSSSGASQSQPGRRLGHRARLLRRTVSGQIVIHTKDGFRTVSLERGTITSVSGSTLTLTEGTRNASYKTATVTIPSDARIRDNGQSAERSSLRVGQRVLVVQAPRRTFVIARTPPASG